jgi:hypothetical protein
MFNQYLKRTILLTIVLFVSIFVVSCQDEDISFTDIQGYNQGLDDIISRQLFTTKKLNILTDDEEDFVESTLNDFKEFNTASVVFNDTEADITNELLDTDIYMENGNLIVNSSRKMTLIVSGELNGSIIINKSDGKLKLVLDGITINSESGPAINLQTEKRVFLVINDDTENFVTDGIEHPLMSNGSKTKAAIFSEEQLIVSGNGELNVTGRYQHGIASDDYIKILSGNINIISAKSDGLRANDYIVIDGGEININADGDGIECEKGFISINGGLVNINAEKNGIKAFYEDADLSINSYIEILNGIINIDSNDKGITSTQDITLDGGAIIISSRGDAVFSHKNIIIEEGYFYFTSLEKQALDARLDIQINGGTSLLYSNSDEVALESKDGKIIFNGGTAIVAGALDFNIESSSTGYLKLGSVQANEIIQIKKENELLTIGFLNTYNHIMVSTNEINPGVKYDLYTSGQIQGNNFYGLFISGTYSNGILKKTITAR